MHTEIFRGINIGVQTSLSRPTRTKETSSMKIGVLGAGTWGIALAKMLCESGNEVMVWSALKQEIDDLETAHIHPKFPDTVLPDALCYTTDTEKVCSENELLVVAVASVYIRSTMKTAAPYLKNGQILVSVAKGIEEKTLFSMTDVIADQLGSIVEEKSLKIAALSGPTHAEEVIKNMPTTIISSCPDMDTAGVIQDVFTNSFIKAALITRGLAEIKRLGMKMGCREQTFYGLAGMGDLIVTALSVHSRNYKAGILLGKGYDAESAIKEVGMVVEGMNALKPAMALSEKYGVELPIISYVYKAVYEGASPADAVSSLMGREKRSELNDVY